MDEGESVTDLWELEIESNFLSLTLSPPPFSFLQKPTIILSPWPRSRSSSLSVLDSVFLSFSFHFLLSRHPALRPSARSFSLFPYHFLSSVVHCSISALSSAYARGITPLAAISFVRRDSDKCGRGKLLCQCQWYWSCERKILMVSEYEFRRAHSSLNRIPLP